MLTTVENVICNLSGRVRREWVGTREFLVAPLTMLVPGVLNGSRGPLLYPADEVEASTPFWEGTIITDGHIPAGANGRRISTQDAYSIGVVQNPVFNNGRLKAEGWFDIERTRRINPDILSALQSGQKIEVSTGLRTVDEDISGIHNGHPYNRIATRYRPCHLAILLNERGACSLDDGCGVLNCESNGPVGGPLGLPEMDWGNSPSGFLRHVVPSSRRGGPVGGALGYTEIDWSSPHPRDVVPQASSGNHQPAQQRQQQRSIATDRNDGPVGGSLGDASPPIEW